MICSVCFKPCEPFFDGKCFGCHMGIRTEPTPAQIERVELIERRGKLWVELEDINARLSALTKTG